MFQTTNLYPNVQVYEAGADSVVRETGANPRVTWKFIIRGADSEAAAHSALFTYLSNNFTDDAGNICAYDIPLDTITVSTTDSDYFHEASVSFAFTTANSGDAVPADDINSDDYEQPEIEDLDYQYSTTGGTSRITHSYETLYSAAAAGGTVVNFGGGIGWNGADFDGVDVITPHVEFSISVNWPRAFFTTAYRLTLANATGSINSDEWNGFGEGCVLFKGVAASPKSFKRSVGGSYVKDCYWRATYAFEANPSTTVSFGGTTMIKRGFDYMWKVASRTEANGGAIGSSVDQVNIERVYPEFDFAGLLLPLPE